MLNSLPQNSGNQDPRQVSVHDVVANDADYDFQQHQQQLYQKQQYEQPPILRNQSVFVSDGSDDNVSTYSTNTSSTGMTNASIHSTDMLITRRNNTVSSNDNDDNDGEDKTETSNDLDSTLADEDDLDKFNSKRVGRLICASLKKNLVPGIILNTLAFLILILFYTVDDVNEGLSYLGKLREDYGILYSFVITAVFGGLLPYVFIIISGPSYVRTPYWIISRFLWFSALWGARGIELDYFYRFQSIMFGDNQKVSTIIYKTLFDEFVYSVIWVAWFLTFISTFELNDFHMRKTFRETLGSKRWWINEVIVANVSAWIVWIPACVAIYALSANLQTTLLNIVMVFWVLLVRIISTSGKSVEKPNEDLAKENSDKENSDDGEIDGCSVSGKKDDDEKHDVDIITSQEDNLVKDMDDNNITSQHAEHQAIEMTSYNGTIYQQI